MLTTSDRRTGCPGRREVACWICLLPHRCLLPVDRKLHEGRDGGLICHGSPCRRLSRLTADENEWVLGGLTAGWDHLTLAAVSLNPLESLW